MRLVIDTNVLISALLSGTSLPADLLHLWRNGLFELLMSADQLDEFRRVTRYPKIRDRLTPALAGRLLNDMRDLTALIPVLPVVAGSPDPDDDHLPALAAAGAADFLITGDKHHLLALDRHRGTKIVSVRAFLTLQGFRR